MQMRQVCLWGMENDESGFFILRNQQNILEITGPF